MLQKHLHELLQEDQEPFHLKNYIADRRFQLNRQQSPKTRLQVKKRKPISQALSFPQNFYKNACLFAYSSSPDQRKSPLFDLKSPASPCKNPNAVLLHVPARTAALLLDAALRIQKQSSSSNVNTVNKNNGFGLFGSFLKRLTLRKKTRKSEFTNNGIKVPGQKHTMANGTSACERRFSCSWNRTTSSAVWSESSEGKSLDLDSDSDSDTKSSTCHSDHHEDFVFANRMIKMEGFGDLATYKRPLCESPLRFVLCKSPCSGHRTWDFSSPSTSPNRHQTEGKLNNDNDGEQGLEKCQANEGEEEEDKEQCSPVSVLDPLFEDGDIRDDDHGEDDGFDLESSYAVLQRAKQRLLQKLRRFEKLAELDPVMLEKRMLEQDHDFDENDKNFFDFEKEEECDGDEFSLDVEKIINRFIVQNLTKPGLNQPSKISRDMKRLVSDLIDEEEEQNLLADKEAILKRVSKRLESWNDVESNTIDMMVEKDFRSDIEGWKRNQKEVEEMVLAFELGIFGMLVEELSEELLGLNG